MKCKLVGIILNIRSKYIGLENGGYINDVDVEFWQTNGLSPVQVHFIPLGKSSSPLCFSIERGSKLEFTIETIE